MTVDVSSYVPPQALAAAVARLHGVTGFVTALHPPGDRRPLALVRYFHVRRVAALADHMARLRATSTGERVDPAAVAWLSWAHDLNRWPFAHNSEVGVFDQAADISPYLTREGIAASEGAVADLEGIIDKRPASLSLEGRIVLMADMVAGFFEDPLWALTVINLHPRFIPPDVVECLAIPRDERAFVEKMLRLNRAIYEQRAPEPLLGPFDETFFELASAFVERRELATRLPFGEQAFEDIRALIKEQFMRGVLFPYNNEKISRGSLLKEQLVRPMLSRLGDGAATLLTRWTDRDFLERAAVELALAPDELERFYPDIDYVQREEPQNGFRV